MTSSFDDHPGAGAHSFDPSDQLSDGGQMRYETMLPHLQLAVVREGRRRHVRRVALRVGATVSLVIVSGAALFSGLPDRTRTRVVDTGLRPPAEGDWPPSISIVRTKPGVVQRMAAASRIDPDDYTLDDRQLVAMLAAIGRPSGLIRSQGRTRLTHSVTDPLHAVRPEESQGPAAIEQ